MRPHMMMALACVLPVALVACGDDDVGVDAGMSDDGGAVDSGPVDSGPVDSGPVDSGPADAGPVDSGEVDAGPMLPEGTVATDVCIPMSADQKVFAVSPDGATVAWVGCEAGGGHVWAAELDGTMPRELATADASTTIEFTLDGAHVVHGGAAGMFVTSADGAAAPVLLAAGVIDEHKLFMERTSDTTFDARILTLSTEGSDRRITIRGVGDGYATSLTLLDDPGLIGDLQLMSASGRTFVSAIDVAGVSSYWRVRTNLAMPAAQMLFGPERYDMAPVGLGDVWNFAVIDDRLVRIRLDDGREVELVPTGSSLLPGNHHVLERQDAPGRKHAHFIVDGNPSRRIRDASEPLETLAMANAIAQVMSPDESTLVYLSDEELFRVDATGATPAARIATGVGAIERIEHVFGADEIVFLTAARAMVRAPLDSTDASISLAAGPVSAMGYDSDETLLLWLDDGGELSASAVSTSDVVQVAEDTVAWSPISDSSDVLVLGTDGLLRSVTPG